MKTKFSKKKFLHIALVFLLLGIFVLICCNGKITKAIIEISSVEAKERSNRAINEAIAFNMADMNLKTEDFFVYTADSVYSADLLVINSLSAKMSSYISDCMKEMSEMKIQIPFGMVTGIDMLAHMGPNINIYLKPAGAVSINTKSEVLSAGINQVNYKIYFDVEIESKIVMPLREQSVIFRREILVVDSVIRGSIPETYLNVGAS